MIHIFAKSLSILFLNILVAAETFAQDALPGAEPPGFGGLLSRMAPMFLMVFFIFYVLIMRPQQQKLKQQRDLLNSLKRGDTVITSAGIIGRIAQVEPDFVLLEIANNVKIKIEPGHIAKQTTEKEKERAKDSDKKSASG